MMSESRIKELLADAEESMKIYSDGGKPSGRFFYARYEGMRDAFRIVLEIKGQRE